MEGGTNNKDRGYGVWGGLITRTGGTVCGGGTNNKDRGYSVWGGG